MIGEVASVHKHLGPGATAAEKCELIGPDGESTHCWLDWADSARAITDLTVSCEQDTTFPRFTLAWARLSNPLGGPARKWLDRRR